MEPFSGTEHVRERHHCRGENAEHHRARRRERLGEGARRRRDAFTSIYDRHYDRVYRHSLRLTPTVHDTEDVAALVFLEAWRRRAHVRIVDGSVLPWLLVTANYVAANAGRSARRHRIALAKLPVQESADDATEDVLDRIDATGRESQLRAAFARLSANDRDVLTLCIVHELPLASAAATLRVPVGTVKSRLSRAKERLADLTGDTTHDAPAIATMGEK